MAEIKWRVLIESEDGVQFAGIYELSEETLPPFLCVDYFDGEWRRVFFADTYEDAWEKLDYEGAIRELLPEGWENQDYVEVESGTWAGGCFYPFTIRIRK